MITAITEADGFALSMLFILAISFGVVLTLLFFTFRGGRKDGQEVDDLIDEVTAPTPPAATAKNGKLEKAKTKEPWEKPADWWR